MGKIISSPASPSVDFPHCHECQSGVPHQCLVPVTNPSAYPEGYAREWMIQGKTRTLGHTWGSLYHALLDRDPFIKEIPCWKFAGESVITCFVDSQNETYLYIHHSQAFFHIVYAIEASLVSDRPLLRRLRIELQTIKQTNHVFGDREYLLFSCLHQHQWASMRFVDSFHPQSPNCPVCGLTWCVVVDTIPSSK